MSESERPFEGWTVVEMLGHRRIAGYVREVTVAGAGFLRVDVPGPGAEATATQLVSPQSIYALTPVSEETARRVAALSRVEPVSRWELQALPAPEGDDGRPWEEAGDG